MSNHTKLYANRDALALKEHYLNHVSAMTQEGLHEKSDIAAELAYRDQQIAALEREVERLKEQQFTDLCNSADVKRLVSVVAYPDNYADQNFSEMAKQVLAKMEQNIKALSTKYGCHCDLEVGMEPDDCVIDSGQINDCVHAQIGIRENSNFRREDCKYWQPINIKALTGGEAG